MKLQLFVFVLLLCAQDVWAETASVQARVVTQESTSWNGGDFHYPGGDAQISVVKIDIPKGARLPRHCHNIPLAAYMMSGELEVVTAAGQKKLFRSGDAFVEVMDTWHAGSAVTDVELIAFYAGQEAMPLSVGQQDDPALTRRCR